jgi:hypothetical protein
MMRRKITFILTLLVLSMGVSIWAQNGPVSAGKFQNANGQNGNGTCLTCTAAAGQSLSTTEQQYLVRMREEEKLARDVYTTLYQMWGVLVFDNIADSEQNHFNAIGTLYVRYGVTDPVIYDAVGSFTNPEIGKLYLDLTARGSISLTEAMDVGATIEEMDIADLKAALAATKKVDIMNVYSNLLLGSANHLRTYVSHLQVLGVTYVPKVLSAEELAEILNAMGPGKGRR